MALKFDTPIENLWEREVEFAYLLRTMESRGVRIDQAVCRRERAIGEDKMYHLMSGPLRDRNPGSPTAIKALFSEIGIPLLEDHKTEKGNYSFGKEAMEDYDQLLKLRGERYGEVATSIVAYRGWDKTVSSYYTPYLERVSSDGRLRCNYNQGGTVSGRLSCSEPNLQQIPRESKYRWNGELKKSFIPKPGYVLISNDYSQLEFRLGAAYAKQENLIKIFNRSRHPELWEKEDRDIFTHMSVDLGRSRQDCKTLTYSKIFGAGKLKIGVMLGEDIPQWVRDGYRKPNPLEYGGENSLTYLARREQYRAAWKFLGGLESSQFYDAWENEYDRVTLLSKKATEAAAKFKHIKLWTGRRRHFQHPGDYRKAYNSLIQGGGAEIVKSAMLRLYREVDNPECEMLLQVHDSVVFEVKESKVDYYKSIITEVMERVDEEKEFGVYFATEWETWG